ncbi:F-actin-monooxygenase mical1, partial [Denticeps clupeoides]|uniref:F-actin-monooxygenase mical1 n=1 Tax=Denticeps clupeoides TaxID=299321 RepID=UPI0010A3AB20
DDEEGGGGEEGQKSPVPPTRDSPDETPTVPSHAPPQQPVPAPRASYSRHSPVPKPRTIHLPPLKPPRLISEPPEDGPHHPAPGPSVPEARSFLQKRDTSDEERSQLGSQDSDSETPASSSTSSSSVKPSDPAGEDGYWSGGAVAAGHIREQKNRRCVRRRDTPQPGGDQGQRGRVRSKFSPWNLSSPRLDRDHRLSVHINREDRAEAAADEEEEEEDEDDEDDEDMFGVEDVDVLEQKTVPSDAVKAEKLELKKMRTLERRAKKTEIQRFHRAQTIQRRLEEIEVTFKDLEEKGVDLERTLRQKTGTEDSSEMIGLWLELVQQKNELVSEESDLMVASRQLELEDKQSLLQLELRRFMELSDSEKTEDDRKEEERILSEILEVVDMRDSLVAFLEEKRLKELSEQQQTASLLETKRLTGAGAQGLVGSNTLI